jgi:hypothetical protein
MASIFAEDLLPEQNNATEDHPVLTFVHKVASLNDIYILEGKA